MGLAADQWGMLEDLEARRAQGWVGEDLAASDRRRRATAIRRLAEDGLCELAPDTVLPTVPAQGGHSPAWAARITLAGTDALQYRRNRAAPAAGPVPEPVEPPVAGRHHIELHGVDVDVLHGFLAAAADVQGVDTQIIREVLKQARAVPGTRRWVVALTGAEEKALGYAFWLDSLLGGSRSHYHFRRECDRTARTSRTRAR
ncbi:hypothetical protein ACFWA9_04425 [Kitasatospora sp. NPDC059973]|uniref:hypothetical protein n=1 Tax=Kitasatospora sp. NPDC059973 TaxID=3347020 RepID=UPI0036909B4F